jgi:hypothetical protein
MILQGSHLIHAAPELVFDRLMDPAVLQRCIPGCERLERRSDDEYDAHMRIGLAAIKGAYQGKVRLSEKVRPQRFLLHMDGKGAAGFVKGSTRVDLRHEGRDTHLSYHADVQVGGLIAAIGSRLIDAAAKKLAGEFFRTFASIVEPPGSTLAQPTPKLIP